MLGSDILANWDTTYSLQYFQPCKDFYGPVDMECNRQIPSTKFEQVPLIKNLVDEFCKEYPHLSIDQVWLIVKSKQGSGFQDWHRDFYLNEKITRTIVINLGAMERSDVPGKAFGPSEDLKRPPPASDLKSPPETITIKEAAPSALKTPPETISIKEDKDFVEYDNERDDSNEEDERVLHLLNLSTIFVVDVKVVLYL